MDTNSIRVIIDWNVEPKVILRGLDLTEELNEVDWLVIKEYPFGTLGYDSEEGIKLQTTLDNLQSAIEFISNFHKKNLVPFEFKTEYGNTEYSVLVSTYDTSETERLLLIGKQLGLCVHPDCDSALVLIPLPLSGTSMSVENTQTRDLFSSLIPYLIRYYRGVINNDAIQSENSKQKINQIVLDVGGRVVYMMGTPIDSRIEVYIKAYNRVYQCIIDHEVCRCMSI